MQVNHKISFTLVCLLATIVASTGCRTLGFKQPAFTPPSIPKPDLGKLAFWKNGEDVKRIPPPPARVFDPAPINGESPQGQVASLDGDESRGRFKNGGDQALDEINTSVTGSGKPIRKPYANDLASEGSSSGDNQFLVNTGNVRSKLEELENDNVAGLNDQQQRFRDAMNGADQQLAPELPTLPGLVTSSEFTSSADDAMMGEFAKNGNRQTNAVEPEPSNDRLSQPVAPLAPQETTPWTAPAKTNGALVQNGNLAPIQSQGSVPLVPQIQPNPFFQGPADSAGQTTGIAKGANSDFSPVASGRHVDHQSELTNSGYPGTRSANSSASRIPNYVPDVDIPEAVLQGKGSYSPGSVNRLKQNK